MNVEVFKGKRSWYWRLRSSNGQAILTSESYFSKWNAKRAAGRLAAKNGLSLRMA